MDSSKKKVTRSCCACRRKGEKRDFLRVVRKPDGEVLIDQSGKTSGRGLYFCRNAQCVRKAAKLKAIERSFGGNINIPVNIYEILIEKSEKTYEEGR